MTPLYPPTTTTQNDAPDYKVGRGRKWVGISLAFWVVVAIWLLWRQTGDTTLPPIVVADGAVTVRNQTSEEWQNVRIWVNEHYAGGARSIPAGGFVRESLSRFVAAQGQTLDPSRTAVTSVVVLGNEPDGRRIRVAWGKPALH